MASHRYIDRICLAAALLSLVLTACFMGGEALGIRPASREKAYEKGLFDTSRVHTIDLVVEDWEGFLETCENEEYTVCAAVIDGESYKNVGLRAKGNTSLSTVSALGSDRYSFKLEFDHYDSGRTCQGLDKLCLNNLIQDNTYMKDYLTYRMMAEFGAVTPLCSFARITVNGQDWGLYLAVEGVEDSFLQRNYGSQHGRLYKPDSTSFGGGRGNGQDFRMEDMDAEERPEGAHQGGRPPGAPEGMSQNGDPPGAPEGMTQIGAPPAMPEGASRREGFPMGGGGTGGMGSDDVKLKYTGDDPENYSNIFESAKTEITEEDKARLIRALKRIGEGDTEALDLEAQLRYLVVHNFVVNGDSYTGGMVHNYYLYEEDGRLSMIPWDYNLAFGTFQALSASRAVNDPLDTPLSAAGDGERPMMDWVVRDPESLALYHQFFARFLETVDPSALIEEAYELIRDDVAWDPTRFCTLEEFEAGVQALREFCALRRESAAGQLAGTIPSTREGQSADSSALVDASGLTLSDMGTMGAGGAMGRGGVSAIGDGGAAPESRAEAFRPERTGGEARAEGAGNGGAAALCLLSALALLGGLFAAMKWRHCN